MRNALGAGVTLDRHDPDRSGKFKAFLKGGVASSPDGLHWSELQDCPEIKSKWDTHNNLFWDERHGKYVGMTRLWDGGFLTESGSSVALRARTSTPGLKLSRFCAPYRRSRSARPIPSSPSPTLTYIWAC